MYASKTDITEIQQLLQKDLDAANEWTKQNEMAINLEKTKYMLIGTNQKLARSGNTGLSLTLNGKEISQSNSERLLGVYIDPNLSWSTHIEHLRKKILNKLAAFARIKTFISIKYRKLLFNAYIKPILEYCVSVWGNCDTSKLDVIFKLQKRFARQILDITTKDTRSYQIFQKLNWYPIDKICQSRRL